MKILLDALQTTNQSGTGSYALALLRHLPGVMPESEIHAACPASTCKEWEGRGLASVLPCSQARFPVGTIRRSAEMRAAIRRIQPDIVHYPANFARRAGRGGSSSVKVVLTIHDLSFVRHPEWFTRVRAAYYRASIRPSARLADLIIADSQATANDVGAMLGVGEDRCVVIHLGVGEELMEAAPADVKEARVKYGLPEHYFLYLGTIEPRKNLPRVIEAFDSVAATMDLHLVIAGREGWKAESTRRASADAAYRARIHFPGFIPQGDMSAVLSGATAFVWPSLWEGFGLPPLEAMACGTPVITSNNSSLPEVTGNAALLVNPEDTADIAAAMKRLATDVELHIRLRTAGLARARELTWRRTAELTAAAYRRVVSR